MRPELREVKVLGVAQLVDSRARCRRSAGRSRGARGGLGSMAVAEERKAEEREEIKLNRF